MLGIAIAAAGALLLAAEDFGEATSLRGDFFALLGAVFVAAYFLAGRRARAKLSNISYAAIVNSVGACALLLALTVAGGSPVGHEGDAYVFIVLLALVPQADRARLADVGARVAARGGGDRGGARRARRGRRDRRHAAR